MEKSLVLRRANNVNIQDGSLSNLNLNHAFNLIDKKASCTPANGLTLTADLKVDVVAELTLQVGYGIAVTGTIIPPHITDVATYADVEAQLTGTINIDAKASVRGSPSVSNLLSAYSSI